MSGQAWKVHNIATKTAYLAKFEQDYKQHGYLRISTAYGKDRSQEQNALSFRWYKIASLEEGDRTPEEVRKYCKLHFGVPILRADDESFCARYDEIIRPLAYELKLKAMDLLPVTSSMNTEQMSRYLNAVQMDFAGRGIILEGGESLLDAA